LIISEVIQYDASLYSAMQTLIPQLSSNAASLSQAHLQQIIASDTSHLLIARDESQVLGMLTVLIYRIPTGTKAQIEDVVVDSQARGKGVGKALIQHAISVAKHHNAKSVDLTSRPHRTVANNLYIELGFSARETNIYRYTIGDK